MVYQITDFVIKDEVLNKFRDLIDLIVASETISDKEQKQYWIDSLEEMSDDQIESLKSILGEEQQWIQKISEEFNDDLEKEKEEERIRRMQELREKEREIELKEQEEEEALLEELENL